MELWGDVRKADGAEEGGAVDGVAEAVYRGGGGGRERAGCGEEGFRCGSEGAQGGGGPEERHRVGCEGNCGGLLEVVAWGLPGKAGAPPRLAPPPRKAHGKSLRRRTFSRLAVNWGQLAASRWSLHL